MFEAFDIMKWPLLACLLLPGLLVYLGLHIVQREIIFVDLALAQVAALGTCFGILLHYEASSWESYALSLGFTFVGAGIFTLTRTKSHRVPQEALIGIVYVVTAALGILLLSRSPEGNEELRRTLIGEVLLVTPQQVLRTFGLFVVIGFVHYFHRKTFLAISFEPERAAAEGISIRWWDFVFYAMFGWVVTSFVQIGGVLLVFSFLIVPAVPPSSVPSASRLSARSSRRVSAGSKSSETQRAHLYKAHHEQFPTTFLLQVSCWISWPSDAGSKPMKSTTRAEGDPHPGGLVSALSRRMRGRAPHPVGLMSSVQNRKGMPPVLGWHASRKQCIRAGVLSVTVAVVIDIPGRRGGRRAWSLLLV